MMMMGLHFMKDVPFYYVYLHALVRDAQGQKMSKSKGNVIDPLTIMEKYGTDAVRFTLAAFAAQGRDIKLSEDRIEGYRHFVNKIWNAARLVLMHASDMEEYLDMESDSRLNTVERWILTRLNQSINIVRKALDNFDFDVAAKELYQFFWHEYCDWYLEFSKADLASQKGDVRSRTSKKVALTVLDNVLRLLHPFMPFVTEELWHHLPGDKGYIMVSRFPEGSKEWEFKEALLEIELLKTIVSGIRNIRAELGIHPGKGLEAVFLPHTTFAQGIVSGHQKEIMNLARVNKIRFIKEASEKPKGAASFIHEQVEIFIPLEGLVDIGQELKKLKKERAKVEKELKRVEGKLSNENFLKKAPKEIVEKERGKMEQLLARLAKLDSHEEMLRQI